MSENKNISTKSTQTNILVIRFRLQLTEQGQSLVIKMTFALKPRYDWPIFLLRKGKFQHSLIYGNDCYSDILENGNWRAVPPLLSDFIEASDLMVKSIELSDVQYRRWSKVTSEHYWMLFLNIIVLNNSLVVSVVDKRGKYMQLKNCDW